MSLKGTFLKANFMFVIIFLGIYENPKRKNFINPSCSKHCKIINWNKKWHNFYFRTSLWFLRNVSFFWGSEKKCENKKFMQFFPLIPLGRQGLRLRFVELPTWAAFTWSPIWKFTDMKLKKAILPTDQVYLNVYMFRNDMKFISE